MLNYDDDFLEFHSGKDICAMLMAIGSSLVLNCILVSPCLFVYMSVWACIFNTIIDKMKWKFILF